MNAASRIAAPHAAQRLVKLRLMLHGVRNTASPGLQLAISAAANHPSLSSTLQIQHGPLHPLVIDAFAGPIRGARTRRHTAGLYRDASLRQLLEPTACTWAAAGAVSRRQAEEDGRRSVAHEQQRLHEAIRGRRSVAHEARAIAARMRVQRASMRR
jgi:hypothetical protein